MDKSVIRDRFVELSDEWVRARKESGEPCRLELLANELGVSRSAVGFWRSGDRYPDARGVMEICQYFEVSADWVLGLTDERVIHKGVTIPAGNVTKRRLQELWFDWDRHHKTPQELNKIVGVHKSYLGRVNATDCLPNTRVVYEACRYTGVSADWLLGLTWEE